jgi:enoyl-CoA hydratase/carnithine racemase
MVFLLDFSLNVRTHLSLYPTPQTNQTDDQADWTMTNNMTEADTEEGIAAFVEKRPPAWDL